MFKCYRRKFADLESAKEYAQIVFDRTGVIVAIEEYQPRRLRKGQES
jgi:hypothetical protein